MSKRNLKRIFFITSFLILAISLVVKFVFDGAAYSKWLSFESFLKNITGGVVINKTNHNIFIADWTNELVLPSGQNSKTIGVSDADYIVIKTPVYFDSKVYKYGIIKLCDFSSVSISESKNIDIIKPSLSYSLCRSMGEGGWYESFSEVIK